MEINNEQDDETESENLLFTYSSSCAGGASFASVAGLYGVKLSFRTFKK
jgi:hypothetical protein